MPILVYERDDRRVPSGALLWIHGGGLIMGTPGDGHGYCSRWADELGAVIVSVEYRLAPEYPFPQGLEDCYTALCWLHGVVDDLGIDPGRIAVGGDSAGGGLAAALTQLARDRGGPPICFQLLVYPMLDDRTAHVADRSQPETLLWSRGSNRFGWTSYLGRPPDEHGSPLYAAPARTEDLTGLPPAWIGVGELDLFCQEDTAYARRLRDAGVDCVLDIVSGT